MKKGWLYNIILSNDKWYRVQRHLFFWLAVYIYQVLRISIFYPPDKLWNGMPAILKMSLIFGCFFLIYFTYTFVYYLVPRFYNRKKYFLFGVAGFLLIVSLELLALTYNYLNISAQVTRLIGINFTQAGFMESYRPPLIRMLGNPPLICGFFLALKTMKNWYKEQLQNDLLARENANAELQLLKAQVHPHFLFNTLNNIYSFTLNQ
ncbi:MAG: histidine kinase, partial [Sphingobacteriales bacterium]|nr:histidine kinase [Sphingobacteriales bacterium]